MSRKRYKIRLNFWLDYIVWDKHLNRCALGPFTARRDARTAARTLEAQRSYVWTEKP